MSDPVKVWTYYGDYAITCERQIQDLIDRGAKVLSLALAHGPSPAKTSGVRHAGDCWHALVVVDVSGMGHA